MGEYIDENGNKIPGSPLIAIENALKNPLKDSQTVFYLIEKDADRFSYLKTLLEQHYGKENDGKYDKLPKNFVVRTYNGEFNVLVSELLDKINDNLAPTFSFVDPFGYYQDSINLEVLRRVLQIDKCELFITWMVGFLDRFIFDEASKSEIKRVYELSDAEFDEIRKMRGGHREEAWLRLFLSKITQKTAKSVYQLSFAVKSNNNRLLYYLIYLTKNKKGISIMKESMWTVGGQSKYVFTDYNFDPKQTTISDFNPKSWAVGAAAEIYKNFRGQTVKIEDVIDYTIFSTPFIWRSAPMALLENGGRIEVIGSRKKRNTYPEGISIKFI